LFGINTAAEINKNILEAVRNYNATPQCSTSVAPRKLMFKTEQCSSRLPVAMDTYSDEFTQMAIENDAKAKEKNTNSYNQKNKCRMHNLLVGERVLLKQQKSSKLSSRNDPNPYEIVAIKGNMISVSRNGKTYARNVSDLCRYSSNLDTNPIQTQPNISRLDTTTKRTKFPTSWIRQADAEDDNDVNAINNIINANDPTVNENPTNNEIALNMENSSDSDNRNSSDSENEHDEEPEGYATPEETDATAPKMYKRKKQCPNCNIYWKRLDIHIRACNNEST
jgi:hypothetical protein